MKLRMWLYDIAREQCPTPAYMRHLCKLSLDSGYNAIGLYLEHRFAYPSVPWVAGLGALTPELVKSLQKEFKELQIVPFINLLGHFEGFLYASGGEQFACERFAGMSGDPMNPSFVSLCESIVDDALKIFDSQLIHIGGDETAQLGRGASQAFVEAQPGDGKAALYARHFAPLAQQVVDAGRTPGVWGDMYFEHPSALDSMPKETMIFDWQYFKSPEYTSELFREKGFRTVFCPAVHTYNAAWCHLPQTERNVTEHAEAAERLGVEGVCVTTWELGLMGNYNTILPVIEGCGAILCAAKPEVGRGFPLEGASRDEDIAMYREDSPAQYSSGGDAPGSTEHSGNAGLLLRSYLKHSETQEEWARLMGVELQECGLASMFKGSDELDGKLKLFASDPFLNGDWFAFGGIRSGIKCRLLLYSNPFLLWLRDRESLLGPGGDKAWEIAERATAFALDSDQRGVSQFVKKAVEFVRQVDKAATAYGEKKPGEAMNHLAPCRQIFEDLEKIAVATNINSCGSLADIHRCQKARRYVEDVIIRIKQYGGGSLGYLPSFETLIHPKFVPHDQANWWLINKWANE